MIPRATFLLWAFFLFLCWPGTAEETTTKKTKCDGAKRGDIICGETKGDHCFKYSCYTFNTTAKTWEDGQKDCKKNGGYLVSIEKKEELVFLQRKIRELKLQNHGEWYIGLRVEGPLWLWINGKPLTVNHFRPAQPSTYEETKAVIDKRYPNGQLLSMNDIRSADSEKRGSICETAKNVSSGVPKGMYCYKTSCYKFVETERSWDDSREKCQQDGGDLVTIETESEWNFIINVMNANLTNTRNFKAGRGWQIGLEKQNSLRKWRWSNTAQYSLGKDVWRQSYPTGKTRYAYMAIAQSSSNPVGIFFDAVKVSDMKPYICEKNIGNFLFQSRN